MNYRCGLFRRIAGEIRATGQGSNATRVERLATAGERADEQHVRLNSPAVTVLAQLVGMPTLHLDNRSENVDLNGPGSRGIPFGRHRD